jgi:hypothetical protein
MNPLTESITACSGPHAAAIVELSEVAGYLSAALCGFIMASLVRHSFHHRGFGWLTL